MRISAILGHILGVAIWLAATRAVYLEYVEIGRFFGNAIGIPWVALMGESLSILILVEGLALVAAFVATHKKLAWKAGRIYRAACVLYMGGYFAIHATSIIVDNMVNRQLVAMSPELVREALGQLMNRWNDDWAQLGYLTIPIIISNRRLSRTSDEDAPSHRDATEVLGLLLLFVMPLCTILYPAWTRPFH